MTPPAQRPPTASQTNQTRGGNDDQPASGADPREKDEDTTDAEGTGVDPQTFRRWRQITSAMPPMTPEEIAATGLILRRIDARLRTSPGTATR